MSAAVDRDNRISANVFRTDLQRTQAARRDIVERVIAVAKFELRARCNVEQPRTDATCAGQKQPCIDVERAGIVEHHTQRGRCIRLFVECAAVVEGPATTADVDVAVEAVCIDERAGVIQEARAAHRDGVVVARVATPSGGAIQAHCAPTGNDLGVHTANAEIAIELGDAGAEVGACGPGRSAGQLQQSGTGDCAAALNEAQQRRVDVELWITCVDDCDIAYARRTTRGPVRADGPICVEVVPGQVRGIGKIATRHHAGQNGCRHHVPIKALQEGAPKPNVGAVQCPAALRHGHAPFFSNDGCFANDGPFANDGCKRRWLTVLCTLACQRRTRRAIS